MNNYGVLVTTDFVRDKDGNFIPTELNTNSGHDLYINGGFDTGSFVETVSPWFDHESFHNFLQSGSFTELILVENGAKYKHFFDVFSHYYGYDFTFLSNENNVTIDASAYPTSSFVLRGSFDHNSILDALYAWDMYNFIELIQSESFSNQCYIPSSSVDITSVEAPISASYPNYVLKPRYAQYDKNVYPKVYSIDNITELQQIKDIVTNEGYLTHYELDVNTSNQYEGRTMYYRTTSIIHGSDLEALPIFHMHYVNSVSIYNDNIIYDNEFEPDGITLTPEHALKFYPTWDIRKNKVYHHDETDLLMVSDGSYLSGSQVVSGSLMKTLVFDNELERLGSGSLSDLTNFQYTSSVVTSIFEDNDGGLFISMSLSHPSHSSIEIQDGVGTYYLFNKSGSENIQFYEYANTGYAEIGDNLLVLDANTNEFLKFRVDDVSFHYVNLKTYLVSMNPSSIFLVSMNANPSSSLHLVQHNFCDATICVPGTGCFGGVCDSCSKQDDNCEDCGGTPTGIRCEF
jgi:hypothetical protein